jgi:hypothetical protein
MLDKALKEFEATLEKERNGFPYLTILPSVTNRL